MSVYLYCYLEGAVLGVGNGRCEACDSDCEVPPEVIVGILNKFVELERKEKQRIEAVARAPNDLLSELSWKEVGDGQNVEGEG